MHPSNAYEGFLECLQSCSNLYLSNGIWLYLLSKVSPNVMMHFLLFISALLRWLLLIWMRRASTIVKGLDASSVQLMCSELQLLPDYGHHLQWPKLLLGLQFAT